MQNGRSLKLLEGVGTLWIRHAMATIELETLSHAILPNTHTHRRTYSYTRFFNSASLWRLEPPWTCFSLRDFSAFGFGKTLCAFSRRKLRKLLLALHGISLNERRVCVWVCLASLVLNALYFATLTTLYSPSLCLSISFFSNETNESVPQKNA